MSKDIDLYIEKIKSLAKRSKLDVVKILQNAQEQLEKDTKKDTAIEFLEKEYDKKEVKESIEKEYQGSAWKSVTLARNPNRPNALAYINYMSEQYIEFHGDRCFGDDTALIGGICTINGIHFTFIANQKGANMKENIKRNYGMAHPEGYRKALRLAKQAERFSRPILTLIDTSGAYPGLASEERGISESIATNLKEFSLLQVPIICIVIGEAGSGGALGIGVGDKIFMLENAVYSVISPEGFASILLREPKRMQEAAELMKMTARDTLGFGFIDGIIPEHPEGAHMHFEETADAIKSVVLHAYKKLKSQNPQQLVEQRSKKIIAWTRDRISATEEKSPKPLLQKVKDFFIE